MSTRRNHSGCVYIVEFGPRHVKIGKSKNPVRRLRTLSNQSGVRATRNWVSPACYNYGEIERELHGHFEKHRGLGEYFSIDFDVAVGATRNFCFDPQNAERDAELRKEEDARWAGLADGFFNMIYSARDMAAKEQRASQILKADLEVSALLGIPLPLAQAEAVKVVFKETGIDYSSRLARSNPHTRESPRPKQGRN